MAKSEAAITIKKYGDRRLYRPDAGAYLSLGDLAAMVEDDEDFVVYEARTGENITHSVLKQIIRGPGNDG
jgi:polyhydroxyalkanoate synthesis regulator protein